MRTHFLERLEIPGKTHALEVFPNFDFYHLGRVTRLLMEEDSKTSSVDLLLTAVYSSSNPKESGEVTLRFVAIRHVKLPEFSPLAFLSELEVEDISHEQ